MIRGMYMAAMGMLNDMYSLNRISNDLANVDTVGYKKDRAAFKTYMEGLMVADISDPVMGRRLVPIGKLEGAVVLDEVHPVMTEGALERTGNPLDLAIVGKGFFKVDRNGEILYTRAGNFKLDDRGYMMTSDGGYLLDENDNRIKIEGNVEIQEDGTIYVNGKRLTKIAIYGFDHPEKLDKFGYTYFKETEESGKPKKIRVGLKEGYVERSNVNALREMVGMIKALRHFEISQRVITSSDELLGRLINNVGSLR